MRRDEVDRIEEQSLMEERKKEAAAVDPNDPIASLSEEQLEVYNSALDGYVSARADSER